MSSSRLRTTFNEPRCIAKKILRRNKKKREKGKREDEGMWKGRKSKKRGRQYS